MGLTAEQAIVQLATIDNTADALRALINQLDVTVDGDITFLYSGGRSTEAVEGLGTLHENIRTIGKTEAGRFLDLAKNEALLDKLFLIYGDFADDIGSDANQFIILNTLRVRS